MTNLTPPPVQLADFFATFPLGTVLFSGTEAVAAINRAFTDLTGLTADEVVGLPSHAFDRLMIDKSSPELPYRPCWRLPQAKTDEANSECSVNTDSHGCHCDFQLAQPHWRRLRRKMQRSPCDSGVVIYFQDVSRESKLDQLKSDFLITSAHELRTPLTMIMGYTEMLLMNELDEIEVNRLHRSMFRQCRHLAGMLDDVLDLARLESRQLDSSRKPLDLGQLALLACGNYQTGDDPRRPRLSIPPEPARIVGDQSQLLKCIHHLLDNAYHYSFGQGEIVVRVVPNDPDGWSVLEICDQGIGMTAEEISNAFERFWRADSSGKHPGSGLGLAIVREIMLRHGGVANIVSTPAQGTIVRLRFPPAKPTMTPVRHIKEL